MRSLHMSTSIVIDMDVEKEIAELEKITCRILKSRRFHSNRLNRQLKKMQAKSSKVAEQLATVTRSIRFIAEREGGVGKPDGDARRADCSPFRKSSVSEPEKRQTGIE